MTKLMKLLFFNYSTSLIFFIKFACIGHWLSLFIFEYPKSCLECYVNYCHQSKVFIYIVRIFVL